MKLKDLKLDYPVDTRAIAQGFSKNAVATYAANGLKGHSGIDFQITWGQPIYSASRGLGVAYKAFNRDSKDPGKYKAACGLIELEDCVVELTYGHCDQILCDEGPLSPREKIATVGNTGEVYYGTELVTTTEKLRGSKRGAHLHFQMRVCYPKKSTAHDDFTLQDGEGMTYIHDGYYLTYKQNGFNGCIDPTLYFVEQNPVDIAEAIVKNIATSDIPAKQKDSLYEQIKKILGMWGQFWK